MEMWLVDRTTTDLASCNGDQWPYLARASNNMFASTTTHTMQLTCQDWLLPEASLYMTGELVA